MIREVNTLYVIIGWRANEGGFAIDVPAPGAGDRKSGPPCLKFLWRENGVNGKRAIACRLNEAVSFERQNHLVHGRWRYANVRPHLGL